MYADVDGTYQCRTRARAGDRLVISSSALRHLVRLVGGGLLVLALTGCMARFDPDTMQPRVEVEAPPVYGMQTVGQTFVAARPGLCAIEVIWRTSAAVTGPIVLHLRSDLDSTADLARVEITDCQPTVRWRFPPIPDSQGRGFYLLIEAPEATIDHPLRLYAAAHDVYTPGRAYVSGSPLSGDLVFRTFYDYDLSMFLQDLSKGLREAWLFLPTVALFWAPGFLLLQCWPAARRRFDGWEQMALAVGLSLAIIPLLLLWITQLGGALSATMVRVLFGGLGVAAAAVAGRRLWRLRATEARAVVLRESVGQAALMVLILGAGLVARFLAVRDLALPVWVDSVHHTVVTRIIAESGQVPSSYEPYIPMTDAIYHYGFHASVAGFSWLSDKPIPWVILVVGQVFNLAAALQVYLLARWLTRRRLAALFAALTVALLATMPAYYVSWGRYTLLGGVLILPVASVLSLEAAGRKDWRAAMLGGLALAGLFLTHYRLCIFHVCLVASWWLVKMVRCLPSWRARLWEVGWYAAVGLLALVLIAPQVPAISVYVWPRAFAQQGGGASAALGDFSLHYVTSGFDRYMLTLGLLGAIVALVRKRRFSIVLLLWVGGLFVVTNPSLLGLPGEALVTNVVMLGTWFMPLAVWCGFLGDELLSSWLAILQGRRRTLCYLLATTGLVVLSVIGIRRQITIVNPDCVLATQSDQEALAWVEQHTSPEDRFLINARPWTESRSAYIGTDGGYWIAPLAQRSTTTPPALYGKGDREGILQVREFNQRMEMLAAYPEGLGALLRDEGIGYVYVGTLGGPLYLEALRADSGFRLIYANGRVHVFEVVER
jgi:hypothetical protein